MTDEESNWKVKEAKEEELDAIRKNLEKFLPESAAIHDALLGMIAYKTLSDIAGMKVYFSPASSFITIRSSFIQYDQGFFFWDRNTMNDKSLREIVSSLPKFDWEKDVRIFSPQMLTEKIESLITDGIFGSGLLSPSVNTYNVCYYSMTSVPDIPIRLPDGYELRELDEKHADHMYSHWAFSEIANKEIYRNLIATAPGFGVFQCHSKSGKSTVASSETSSTELAASLQQDPGDNLVSWSHLSFGGSLSNTFTLQDHRRKGLANAVTIALANKSIEDKGIAGVNIIEGNKVSESMHQKLGFIKQINMTFLLYRSSQ